MQSTSWLPCMHCWLFPELAPELPQECLKCLLKHAPPAQKQSFSVFTSLHSSLCPQTGGVCFNLYKPVLDQSARMHDEALGSMLKAVQTHPFPPKKRKLYTMNKVRICRIQFEITTLQSSWLTGLLLALDFKKFRTRIGSCLFCILSLSTKCNTKVVS